MRLARSQLALGVLAGGQARRLGGVDKALAMHAGRTLAERTLAALGEGFAQVLLSYNREPSGDLPANMQQVPDLRPSFPGPLAGVEALLAATDAPWLLTVPVDLAEVPKGLAEALAACVQSGEGVRAQDADGEQPLVALWPVAGSRVVVGAALDRGERAVHRVQALLGFGSCAFPSRFGNLNTPSDLQA